jgi:hypothetical protein
VSWIEPHVPAGPPPYIAPDHTGCASFDDISGLKLCFHIMSDVSSVGVNARDTSIEGLCDGAFENPTLSQAAFEDGVLTVDYQGTCHGQPQKARLTLKQL